MINPFTTAFFAAMTAIAGIFVIIFGAGFLVRRKIINEQQIDGLSSATVKLFLPCLIFAKVVQTLDPKSQPGWWVLPIAGVVMALVGTALGAVVFFNQLAEKKDLLTVSGMQNAGYLVLPIGFALFPDQFDTFAIYVFLFILGYNPVLWSLGKILISGDINERPKLRDLITPPLVANVTAIIFALTGVGRMLPTIVIDAIDLVGSAAVPVATVVLGAVLGGISFRLRTHLFDALRTISVKFVALPALVVLVLQMTGLHGTNPLLAEFFVIEAASAPAVALVLQVRTYGGNEERIGSAMILSYITCVVALPLWVAVWRMLVA